MEVLDVARDRRGQEGRGRRCGFRRQYRSAHGHGQVRTPHHGGDRPAGDRGDLADAERRIHRPRSRRHHRRRCRTSRPHGRHGQRDGAGAVRARAADGGAPQYRSGGGEGTEEVREASRMLREGQWPQFQYSGFVEGDDIGKGTVDVVVTEGFAGNIALKAAEGTARQMGQYLRQEMGRTLATKLGYLLARQAFRALANKMDPRKSNGGVFLGLNGIVIKSHGGTDAEGFAYAVDLGYDMVHHELLAKIGQTLGQMLGKGPPEPPQPGPGNLVRSLAS